MDANTHNLECIEIPNTILQPSKIISYAEAIGSFQISHENVPIKTTATCIIDLSISMLHILLIIPLYKQTFIRIEIMDCKVVTNRCLTV